MFLTNTPRRETTQLDKTTRLWINCERRLPADPAARSAASLNLQIVLPPRRRATSQERGTNLQHKRALNVFGSHEEQGDKDTSFCTVYIVKKATRRLYFLKQLKRAGLTSTQLFHYYTAVIIPVLEYCAPVRHYVLTKSHTLQLEAIHKRVIQIVLNFSREMPYSSMLFAADLNSLASRREDISRKCFHNITQSTSCLHHLLPDPKLSSHNSRLRSYEKFPMLHTRTKRYRSFVQ